MDDSGTDRDTRPAGRRVSMCVFGDTAVEIELAALDVARAFFGDACQLEIVPDYKASGMVAAIDETDKKYRAEVSVRVVG